MAAAIRTKRIDGDSRSTVALIAGAVAAKPETRAH